MQKHASVEAYLENVAPEKRAALEKLRASIKRIVPRAEECIAYGMPAFKLDGKPLVYYAATTRHCAFYPTSGPIEGHAKELKNFDVSKGTIRFQPEKPLSQALIRSLLKFRLVQLAKKNKS